MKVNGQQADFELEFFSIDPACRGEDVGGQGAPQDPESRSTVTALTSNECTDTQRLRTSLNEHSGCEEN